MTVRTPIAIAALVAGLLVVTGPTEATAAPTDAAFNSSTGTLNVDRAAYLARHDIVYNRANANPLHGLTTPQLDAGVSSYQQRLSLHDGTLTTRYDNNRTVTVMGSPNSEVMGIHVEDTRPGVSAIALNLSLWDPNSVQNIADVPNLQTWRTVSTFADSAGVGLSRGQADPNNFGYTLAATVEGAAYSSQTINGTQVRLNITPSSSYTIWFTAASRINSPGLNSVQQAGISSRR
jgi:alpha-L-fucosidase 2